MVVPFGGNVFRQESGVQRKPVLAFAVFQGLSAQNGWCSNAVCPECLHSYDWGRGSF